MTKEEILVMEAGRDLDWLICTEIFEGKTLGSLKPYSSDISAAFQVVELLDRQSYKLYIEPLPKGGFETGFLPSDKLSGVWVEDKETANRLNLGAILADSYTLTGDLSKLPEAICRAALLVKIGGRKEL